MNDTILEGFLARQLAEGMALAAASDLVELHPLGPEPVQRYVARLRCRGLVRRGERVTGHECFDLGIQFPTDYLRRVNPLEVVTLLAPAETWHPNCRPPGFCPGHIAAGTTLVEILHQCVEILSWRKVTMKEDDCMNPAACAWARANRHRFPVDDRPLRRRAVSGAGARPAEADAQVAGPEAGQARDARPAPVREARP